MAYRDEPDSPWTRVLRTLNASFRLGHFFGVELRVYWIVLVVTPLVLLHGARGLPFLEGAAYVVPLTLALYLVVWTHEMGHITAGRRYGIHTPLITLSPLGGVAHMGSGAPSPGKDIVISLAGPAVHVLWLAVLLLPYLLLDWGATRPQGWLLDPGVSLVDSLFTINLMLLGFNLLPLFPMDGGRVLRAALARRMHPNRATLIAVRIGTVGAVAFLGMGLVLWILDDGLWGIVLAMIGLSNLSACRQERLAALHGAGPYMNVDVLQPWQTDPEAWKHTGGAQEPRGPGRLARRRARRAAARREREARRARDLDAQLDRVLARVSEVGLQGLTASEKAILQKASQRGRNP
jgi:Zn-dependent protease